jgi:aspartyl-tRNA(Asn)/glutamyl-tRNA(Gln) amidotransferase subunit C
MSLSPEDVRNIALLARLELSETELKRYSDQLGKILEYTEQLQQVDTTGIDPMITASVSGNVFREDQPCPSLSREAALACSPHQDERFFLVPKVIE